MGKNGNIHPTRNKDWYVYIHKKDDDTPVYVGIGKKAKFKRAFQKSGRNKIWGRILKKYPISSVVIYTDLSHGEACEIEKTLIQHFGRIDLGTGTLCNLTDGGEGNCNTVFTKERKEKIRLANTGRRHKPETIEKFKKRNQTEVTKEKIRQQKIGLKASEATRNKMKVTNMKGINAAAKKIRKPLIDVETGVFYDSVREASKLYGITHGHLSNMLLGRYKNRTNLRYA